MQTPDTDIRLRLRIQELRQKAFRRVVESMLYAALADRLERTARGSSKQHPKKKGKVTK
jgi:hypothetical protein